MGTVLPIIGAGVVLTEMRDTDIDRVVQGCARPAAVQYLSVPQPYTRDDAEFFVRQFVPAGWRGDHDERVWAIRRTLDGDLAGVIGLRATHHDVGFWAHPDAEGHGLLAAALRLAVSHAFDCLDWTEVRWEAVPGSVRSARVAKAAGFDYAGIGEMVNDRTPGQGWTAYRYRQQAAAPAQPWPDLT